jgi:NAD(P)-dependent dehydrogenase (short-subunit alcohol dehydrogenase family)
MTYALTGKVAVVTGGASGIGESCARLFKERGAKVVIADVNLKQAEAVAKDLGGAAVEMDVRSAESVDAAAAKVEKDVGPTEIVVTSAGVTQLPLPAETMPLADFDRMQEIDLRGTWLSMIAFSKYMLERKKGSIVTIASITGMRSVAPHSYAAAKAAVIHLTASLAGDWGRSGIRVNCVSPGYTLTPLLRSLIEKKERDPSGMINDSAMGRLVESEEIAKAAAFLASDEASAITGINIPVDCGWLAGGTWSTYGGVRPPRS